MYIRWFTSLLFSEKAWSRWLHAYGCHIECIGIVYSQCVIRWRINKLLTYESLVALAALISHLFLLSDVLRHHFLLANPCYVDCSEIAYLHVPENGVFIIYKTNFI